LTTEDAAPPRLKAWMEMFGTLSDATASLAALELGVFAALVEGPADLAHLADTVSVSPPRLRPTLDLVVACGFLARNPAGSYSLPEGDAAFYDPEGPWLRQLGARDLKANFHRRGRTVEVLRANETITVAGTGGGVSEAERREFLEYLHAVSQGVAEEVAEVLAEPPIRRFADLGGGVGTYTHAVLRRHPEATAVVVDRPNAESVAREFAAEAGMADRLEFLAVDFMYESFGEEFDVVLLSNIVHCYGPDDNRRLLRRVRDALAPGGRVVIKDLLLHDDRRGPRGALRFGTSMALFSDGGDVWSAADIKGWFDDVGLDWVDTRPLQSDEDDQLVTGRLRPR
jgi:SAM-dependent methyltransferase